MNTRNDPESPENEAMSRDNDRAVFAAQMMAKHAEEPSNEEFLRDFVANAPASAELFRKAFEL